MASCTICAKKLNFMEGFQGMCAECWSQQAGRSIEATQNEAKANVALEKERSAAIEAVLLTTETAPDLKITKRIEIVTAEVAYGMNIFKDLFAGVRDIVGGRSEAVQKTMRDSRRTALYKLKKEAHAVGANAVIGVDLDYIELSSAGSMVLLVASGTAVIVEGIEDCSK